MRQIAILDLRSTIYENAITMCIESHRAGALLLLGVILLLAGCDRAGPVETDPPPDTPSFNTIQTTIFNTNCAVSGCHAGSSPAQGMNLSAGAAYDAIVGVPSNERPELLRVDPGNPDESYLLLKIEGDPSIVGSRMPLGRTPLSDEQIQLVRDWIEDGAPEE